MPIGIQVAFCINIKKGQQKAINENKKNICSILTN